MNTELDITDFINAAAHSSRAALYQIDWGSGVDPDPATLEDHFDYAAAAAAEAADDRRRAFEEDPIMVMAAEALAANASVVAYWAANNNQPRFRGLMNEADGERQRAAEIANAALVVFNAADAAFNAADAAKATALKAVSVFRQEFLLAYAAYQAADAACDVAYHSEKYEREERERQA